MAASPRSRRRSSSSSSPLRGGHGGGFSPFVPVTSEVFLHQRKNNANFALHKTPAICIRRHLFGVFAPPQYSRRQALFLEEIEEEK